MADSAIHNGWKWDAPNSRLEFWYRGTQIGYIAATSMQLGDGASSGLTVATGGITATAGGITATAGGITATAGGITATAGGITATAGDITATADDFIGTSGNVMLANPGTFASTQPVGAVVMGGTSLNGVAPAGAIATAGAVFASDTVVRKIIAAGTASNVES